jgi:CO/xanthine dehydrogenase Mo-binding subunit
MEGAAIMAISNYLVDSGAPPPAPGELGVPPKAPAICYAATGKQIRSLPIEPGQLKAA